MGHNFFISQDKVWQKLANMMDLGPKERFSFEGILFTTTMINCKINEKILENNGLTL